MKKKKTLVCLFSSCFPCGIKVTLRLVMDFGKSSKLLLTHGSWKASTRSGLKVEGKQNMKYFLFYTILFLKAYTECIATKRAALSLRSPAVSLSLPLQMNGHPRWQRQAFTGRPLHLHLIFAGSSSANGEARRWLSLERDWPISAMSVREEAGFRGRKRRGKKKRQRLTASLRLWSNTTLWYKKGPCV